MGIPLSLAMGVSSVTTADPPLNREELAFPTPCGSFYHGAGSRRSVIPAKTLLDLESTPGVTSSICTRPTDREHSIASYEMKEISLRPVLPVSVLWEHDLQACLAIIVTGIIWPNITRLKRRSRAQGVLCFLLSSAIVPTAAQLTSHERRFVSPAANLSKPLWQIQPLSAASLLALLPQVTCSRSAIGLLLR